MRGRQESRLTPRFLTRVIGKLESHSLRQRSLQKGPVGVRGGVRSLVWDPGDKNVKFLLDVQVAVQRMQLGVEFRGEMQT